MGKFQSLRRAESAEAVKSPKVMNVAKWIPKCLQSRTCIELAPIVDTNAASVARALPETYSKNYMILDLLDFCKKSLVFWMSRGL